jgi:NAD(P)-dependent dehydrogenase (short-subunit alcohol dehydrogenase family)
VQLTKSMAIELAQHNIQVNAIAPGWIETDMTAVVRTMPMNDEILVRTPAGRWVNPRSLLEQLCTWPRGLRTSLRELRFVSTAPRCRRRFLESGLSSPGFRLS